MDLSTQLSKPWKKRQLIATAGFIFFALYCYYDGAIDWPKKNERFVGHRDFMEQHKDLPAEQSEAQWKEFARSKGWPPKPPHKFHSRADLIGQFVMGSASLLAGLLTAGWFFVSSRQRLFSKDGVIHSVNGKEVPIGSITAVDRRKWETKGIAYAAYTVDGKSGKITLDDYKFAGAEQIILEAEKALGIEYSPPPAASAEDEQPESPPPSA